MKGLSIARSHRSYPVLGVSLPDPQGAKFPKLAPSLRVSDFDPPLSAAMKSATKWALIAVIATTTFLSGLTLPTTASNPNSRAWVAPLPGDRPLLTGYMPHVKRSSGLHIHQGVDFAATFGEEIRAPMNGVISYVGTINEIPIVVLTHHDQLVLRRTTYLPASTDWEVGRSVAQGEMFARVAPIFHCARPCLHWGERIGKSYSNPMKHLGRAVLLPRFN